jgi:hypothetical protein
MKYRLTLLLTVCAAFLLSACGTGLTPTQVVLVVTATPETADATAEVTNPDTDDADERPSGALPVEDATATPEAVGTQPTAQPTEVLQPTDTPETPLPTATPDIFPTPTRGQIYVAEQSFENGRMFWLRPIDQIWVVTTTDEGQQVWDVYEDTFEDGMPESDPSLEPPNENLYQPVRGFGLLWRETDQLRETLGWATAPEVGYFANYEYHPGGTVNEGRYVEGFGYHLVENLERTVYRFNEGDRTWEIVEEAAEDG